MRLTIFSLLFFAFLALYFPSPAHAQIGIPWGDCFDETVQGAENVATIDCLPVVILNVTNALLLFAGATALFIIVWAGIRYIISGGDAKQISSARAMITYAIIGLVVVLSSYAILSFIGYVTRTSNCITNLSTINKGCE